LSIEEQCSRGWIGHIQQVPRNSDLKKTGLLVQVPIGQSGSSLGPVHQAPTVVETGREEGAVPAEFGPVGNEEQRIESPVFPVSSDHGPPKETAEVVAGSRIDPEIVALVIGSDRHCPALRSGQIDQELERSEQKARSASAWPAPCVWRIDAAPRAGPSRG